VCVQHYIARAHLLQDVGPDDRVQIDLHVLEHQVNILVIVGFQHILGSVWCEYGASMVLVWCWYGGGVVLAWCWYGAGEV
jgi:hypothetical protein